MDQERVLGYLDVVGGGFRPPHYTLVATDRRLIIAPRTKAVVAAAGGGGGGLGRLFGGGTPAVPVGQHYLTMSPEAILAETAGNVSISAGDVRLAETIVHDEVNDEGPPTRWVLVHLAVRDHDWQLFTVGDPPRLDAVQALLRPALGATLRS
jgi:hypothetical protein